MQVSEGIHRLTQGVTNFYLIEESGKYTLVDAGTPADWAFFARSLAGLGAKLADVDAVLLTHAHPDHTGFAERPAPRPARGYGSTAPTSSPRAPARPASTTERSRPTCSGRRSTGPRFPSCAAAAAG